MVRPTPKPPVSRPSAPKEPKAQKPKPEEKKDKKKNPAEGEPASSGDYEGDGDDGDGGDAVPAERVIVTEVLGPEIDPVSEVAGEDDGTADPVTKNPYAGFGDCTRGGTGGTVVEVTTLADTGTGSLRAALNAGDNLKIVFTVAGAVKIRSPLAVTGSGITIAGETAPEPGITIDAGESTGPSALSFSSCRDVIARHLRVRGGATRNIVVERAERLVLDHLSSTGGQGGLTVSSGSGITVSWCLIADCGASLNVSGLNVSLHHNLVTDGESRNPALTGSGAAETCFDFRNNVVRNWTREACLVGSLGRGNVVNNVFGPAAGGKTALAVQGGEIECFVDGNLFEGGTTGQEGTLATPIRVPGFLTQAPEDARANVMTGVGALPRDPIDEAVVAGE